MEEKRKEEMDFLISSKFKNELEKFITTSKKITEPNYQLIQQKKDYEEKDYDDR